MLRARRQRGNGAGRPVGAAASLSHAWSRNPAALPAANDAGSIRALRTERIPHRQVHDASRWSRGDARSRQDPATAYHQRVPESTARHQREATVGGDSRPRRRSLHHLYHPQGVADRGKRDLPSGRGPGSHTRGTSRGHAVARAVLRPFLQQQDQRSHELPAGGVGGDGRAGVHRLPGGREPTLHLPHGNTSAFGVETLPTFLQAELSVAGHVEPAVTVRRRSECPEANGQRDRAPSSGHGAGQERVPLRILGSVALLRLLSSSIAVPARRGGHQDAAQSTPGGGAIGLSLKAEKRFTCIEIPSVSPTIIRSCSLETFHGSRRAHY